jgi:hypothetical protein
MSRTRRSEDPRAAAGASPPRSAPTLTGRSPQGVPERIAGPAPRPAAPVSKASLPAEDLAQRIRDRAYQIYKQRNGAPGDPIADWLTAEDQIARGE